MLFGILLFSMVDALRVKTTALYSHTVRALPSHLTGTYSAKRWTYVWVWSGVSIADIFSFMSHLVSVATVQLCPCAKADRQYVMNERDCVPIKLYRNKWWSEFGPWTFLTTVCLQSGELDLEHPLQVASYALFVYICSWVSSAWDKDGMESSL